MVSVDVKPQVYLLTARWASAPLSHQLQTQMQHKHTSPIQKTSTTPTRYSAATQKTTPTQCTAPAQYEMANSMTIVVAQLVFVEIKTRNFHEEKKKKKSGSRDQFFFLPNSLSLFLSLVWRNILTVIALM